MITMKDMFLYVLHSIIFIIFVTARQVVRVFPLNLGTSVIRMYLILQYMLKCLYVFSHLDHLFISALQFILSVLV